MKTIAAIWTAVAERSGDTALDSRSVNPAPAEVTSSDNAAKAVSPLRSATAVHTDVNV